MVGQEILARKVLVLYGDNRQILADLSEVLTVVSKGKKPAAENPPPAENEG